jgi:hypothetical protein
MVRGTHSKKGIADALNYAEKNGWCVESGGKGHAWGNSICPYNDADCRCGDYCIISVWSTPKSPGNHTRHIKRVVDNCMPHRQKAA